MKRLASLDVVATRPHKSTPRSTPQGDRPAVEHIGIDAHKRESQIYIVAEGG